MSADNFYVVVPHPSGTGFTPVMGFASCDDEASVRARPGAPVYATPLEALEAVIDEYAEYGHSISPACYPAGEGPPRFGPPGRDD